MSDHLPECPTTTDPHGLDDGYACPCECQCEILRACEQRAEAGAYNAGYVDGSKDAREGAFYEAREAVAATGGRMWIGKAEALAAIDALLTTDHPPTSPAKAKPADLHDPQMGEMIHGDR